MNTESYKNKLKEELQKLKLELIAAACDQEKRRITNQIKHRTDALSALGG